MNETEKIIEEEKVNTKYIWNLKDIYENEEDIEKDIEDLRPFEEKIKNFEGKLNNREDIFVLLDTLNKIDEISDKIFTYAFLRQSINQNDMKAREYQEKAEKILEKISENSVYITPELCENSDEKLLEFSKDEKLKKWKMFFEDLVEEKKHILTKEQELLVKYATAGKGAGSEIYSYLSESELIFDDAVDKDGNKHKMSHSAYSKYIESKDAVLRKNAYLSMYKAFERHNKSFSASYISVLESASKYIKYRNYDTYLGAVLKNEDSSEKVYNTLIKTVKENLNIVFKFGDIKEKIFKKEGIISENEKIHPWDASVKPFDHEDKKYTFEESKKNVIDSLNILGEEYLKVLNKAFNENWIDVYPRENKESGGYNLGLYGGHPYILLNYENVFSDVTTLAHELGHAAHSYYSGLNNPRHLYHPGILLAEIASTTNEIILATDRIEKEQDKKKKTGMIYELINTINATLIVQTKFAEFEEQAFKLAEEDYPITPVTLNELCLKLRKEYSKPEKIDKSLKESNIQNINEEESKNKLKEERDLVKYNWSRIPHFYRPFYVYKYATGITAAINIYENIKQQGDTYIQKYLEFLKKGGNGRPLEVLKEIDIDLENKDTYNKAFKFLDHYVNKLDELVSEIYNV